MKAFPLGRLWWYVVLLPFVCLTVFPYVVMAATSLKSPEEIARAEFSWLPESPRPGNYLRVFEKMPLARSFLNSLIIAVGATVLNLTCAIPAAYALGRLRFTGRNGALLAILMTQMFSPIVLIIALFSQFSNYGLLVEWRVYIAWILANAAASLAFSIWLLTGYFSTIPRELEEAALIDGCTRLQTVWRVLLPVSRPGVVTAMIFAFIMAWNEYVYALTFSPSDDYRPLTVAIPGFIGQYATQWEYLTAAAVMATAPVIALFFAVERYLVKGLTAGSLK